MRSPERRRVQVSALSKAVSAACGFTFRLARAERRASDAVVNRLCMVVKKCLRRSEASNQERCATVTREEKLHMKMPAAFVVSVLLGACFVEAQQPPQPPAQQQPMSFFVTSV